MSGVHAPSALTVFSPTVAPIRWSVVLQQWWGKEHSIPAARSEFRRS